MSIIIMIHTLFEKLFGTVKNSSEPKRRIDVLSGGKEDCPSPPSPVYEDPEIEVLARVFGPMTEGKVIDIRLSDLLQILPRTRKKTDAYNSLRKRLEALGVQLRVTSRVNNQNNEQNEE